MLDRALKDILIYGLSSILTRGMSFLLIPFYTSALSTEDFGAFDLILTLAVLANLAVALEISQGLARFWHDEKSLQARVVLASTTLIFTLLMYILFSAVCLVFSEQLSSLLFTTHSYVMFFEVGIVYVFFNGIYYLLINQFRWELRSKEYAAISLIYSLGLLGATALATLVLKQGLMGIIAAQAAASFFGVLICLGRLKQSFSLTFDYTVLRNLLQFSIPLVPAGLAVFVNLYINRFALSQFGSLSDVGLYSLANRIAGITTLLLIGVQAAITPLIYQNHAKASTPGEIATLFNGFATVALLLCLGLSLFSGEVILLISGPEYTDSAPLIAILAPAVLLSQLYVFAPGMAIAKKTRLQLTVTLVAAVVSLIANWVLVPLFNIHGAAFATLLSSITFFGLWLRYSQTLYPVPFNWRPVIIALVLYIVLLGLGEIINHCRLDMMLTFGLKAVLVLAFVLVLMPLDLFKVSTIKQLLSKGKV